MSPKTLIIGAGLSGLYTAFLLQQHGLEVEVLEARNRIGGRAFSKPAGNGGAIDLGPAWIWPKYQPRVTSLVKRLSLETLPQFERGDLCFETPTGLQRITYPTRYHDTARLRLGVQGLADALYRELHSGTVTLSAQAQAIKLDPPIDVVLSSGAVHSAQRVAIAVPGPLSSRWSYSPPLPDELHQALNRWPTWMAAHAKFVAIYERPFWRELGLSGSAISQLGPLMEIADQSDEQADYAALFGFIGWPAEQRRAQQDQLEPKAIEQLVRLFGDRAGTPLRSFVQDWSEEEFTASAVDQNMPGAHPPYGEAPLQQAWYDGRVVFAGAEAAAESGGLIEGALAAAEHAAGLLLRSD